MEQDVIQQVDVGREWELLEKFSKLVRVSGTEDEQTGSLYIAGKLREYGIKVTVHEPELFISQPISASVKILSPRSIEIRHEDMAMNPKTSAFSNTGIYEGEIVHVPSNASVDNPFNIELEKNVDARNKSVLTDGMLFEAVAWEAQSLGAKAILTIAPGKYTHEGIITSIWGTPTLENEYRIPNIIGVTLSHEDGVQIKELLKFGPVKVRVETKTNTGWFKCPVVVAEIEPTDPATKDFILLHGHHDSWHVGIGDNAVGDATMLEVARVLQESRDKLKRAVKIAWWAGHSTGRYAGSTWFADNFALDLWENCIAQINCDSPGCKNASDYEEVMWMDEAESFCKQVIWDVASKEAKGVRPERAGDYSFNGIGMTGFFMLLSNMTRKTRDELGYYGVGGCGGNLEWHTEYDDMRVADKRILEIDTRIYLLSLFRLATCKVLPFDYRATARKSMEIISSYERNSSGEFSLKPILDAFRSLLSEMEKMYELAGKGETLSAEQSMRLNEGLKRIARIFIPLSYTRAGKFDHDEALDIPPYPGLFPARMLPVLKSSDRNRYLFLKNQLLRERNKVVGSIKGIQREVEFAINSLTA